MNTALDRSFRMERFFLRPLLTCWTKQMQTKYTCEFRSMLLFTFYFWYLFVCVFFFIYEIFVLFIFLRQSDRINCVNKYLPLVKCQDYHWNRQCHELQTQAKLKSIKSRLYSMGATKNEYHWIWTQNWIVWEALIDWITCKNQWWYFKSIYTLVLHRLFSVTTIDTICFSYLFTCVVIRPHQRISERTSLILLLYFLELWWIWNGTLCIDEDKMVFY